MSVADNRQLQTIVQRVAVRVAHLMRAAHGYPAGHPTRLRAAETLISMADEALSYASELRFLTGEDAITCDGVEIAHPDSAAALLRELHSSLQARAIGGLHLCGGLDVAQLDGFIAVVSAATLDLGPEVVNGQLVAAGVNGLRVLSGERDTAAVGHAHDPNLQALRLYLRGVRAIDRLHKRGVSPAILLELADLADGCVTLIEAAPRRAMALATPRAVLPYELRHPVHMAILSIAMGHRLGLPRPTLVDLAQCALVADVGMKEVPMELRTRAGKLSPEEQAQLQSHPLRAVIELLRIPRLDGEQRRKMMVAYEHHLGVNAKGYPKPLSWGELHPFSRIVSLADAWDALRANTSYRQGKTAAEAMAILRAEAGTRFDPVLIDVLSSVLAAWGVDGAHG